MIPSGIDPVTFQFVAQCFNHHVPQRIKEVLITYTESIFSFNTDPSVFVAR
jgi:hypothetical protein